MKYRPEIDGLRAAAVIPVIIYHLFPSLFLSGFIGVDIFFAISGYLITSIVLQQLEKGEFSLKNFWARRIKRLFPVLILVSISSLIAGYFLLLPDEFSLLGSQVSALFLMSPNINLWKLSGYWSPAAEDLPLLHTWSLGVEEQFYVTFVFALVLLLKKFSTQTTFYIIAFVAFLSNLHREYASITYPSAAFYLLPTRAWELLAGSLVAYFQTKKYIYRNYDYFGFLFLIISFLIINKDYSFPGYIAILPILGTCLILLDGQSKLSKKILAIKPMIYIGKISYSLYLWHWVLIVFYSYYKFTALNRTDRIILLIASILIASVTYHFVENPLRFKKGRDVIIINLFMSLCLTIISLLICTNIIQPTTTQPIYQKGEYTGDKFLIEGPWKNRTIEEARPLDILVIGSSHALMYTPLIAELCKSSDLSVEFLCENDTVSPWISLIGYESLNKRSWTIDERLAFDQYRMNVISNRKPKIIISIDRLDNIYMNFGHDEFKEIYNKFFSELLSNGAYLITTEQPPFAGPKENLYKHASNSRGRPIYEPIKTAESRQNANNVIASICSSLGERAIFISTEKKFLKKDGSVRFSDSSNNLYYKDDDHLNDLGIQLIRDDFNTHFKKILHLE